MLSDVTHVETGERLALALGNMALRHQTIVALLRDQTIEALEMQVPDDERGVYVAGVANALASDRDVIIRQMRKRGVSVLECAVDQLAADAVAGYLRLKSRGR